MFLVSICRVYGFFRYDWGWSMGGLWIDFWGLGQGLGDFRLIRSRSMEDFGKSKRGLWGFRYVWDGSRLIWLISGKSMVDLVRSLMIVKI
jgi:hypothetical protein